MSISEYKEKAKESLQTLYEIAETLEEALDEADDYWTWPGFYADKKDELMPIKDRGKEAVDKLQESVESLRELDTENQYDDFFSDIDEKKEAVKDVVDSLREMGSVKNAIMNGEVLADLIDDLLDRFRETAHKVEDLLDAMARKEGE